MSLDVIAEFHDFLDRFLPSDYDDRYLDYRHDLVLRREFQVAAFDEGWLMPEWEVGLGGRDLALPTGLAIRIEGARRCVPRLLNIQGAGVVAPALRAFGTPAQREQWLRPVLRGDEWWALGMSEPDAGSDLASLRTSAVADGADFIVNGQKVWTTQADESRWCTLYARTDPLAPKHKGISCLVLDLRAEGVQVRPLRPASPAIESFCEVFLQDVRIPRERLLGPLHGGWSVAVQSLDSERDMIWIHNWMELLRALQPTIKRAALDAHQLQEVGRLLGAAAATRFIGLRTFAERLAGKSAPEFNVLKLLGSESVQAAAQLALDVGGVPALADVALFDERMESLGATIYGGTSEIQRNIIAERVLGLPRDR